MNRPFTTISTTTRLITALAGSALTAVGLGGPAAGGALGAEAPAGSTTTGAGEQPTTTTTATNPESTSTTTTPTGSTTTPSGSTTSTSTVPTTTSTPPPTPTPSTTSTESTPSVRPSTGETGAPAVVVHRKQQTTPGATTGGSGANAGGSNGAQHKSSSTTSPGASTPTNAPNNVAAPPQLVAAQASAALEAMLSGSTVSAQALDFYRIPLFLLPIYRAAAVQYDVPWPILAAINEIETDYGTDLSVSSAGAEGWMQFEPGTWLQYGVDALNAGYADPYNPVDAIFAAARYLHAAGAAQNLSTAIFAYNHSTAYVESVLLRAKLIAAYPDQVVATLTGLVDGRPPVTGARIGWSAPVTSPAATASLPASSSATAGASPASQAVGASGVTSDTTGTSGTSEASGATAPATANAATASTTPGSAPAPTPAGAVAAVGGGSTGGTGSLQLVDVTSAPTAHVVAVEDGRVVKLGHSHRLGDYVVLRDVYGDEFTYAGLGHLARTYTPAASPAAATAARTPKAGQAQAGAGPSGSATPAATGVGKVRVFAHPGNPDARAAMRIRARHAGADGPQPLRAGSIVSEGAVLGTVSMPPGALDGHLRFAIRPAGDTSTIDPRAILENWTQLDAALHPQGARGNPSLLGATAADVFLMSKSQLERAVLADPGIALSSCSRHEVASGALDARALAAIAFLSRSGLKPTVGTLRCGAYDAAGYVQSGHAGDAVAIVAINGVPISGHQGAGSITDTTIRTLLTIQGRYAPARIVSLMRYPNAPSTLARADHGAYVELVFPASAAHARGARSGATASAASSASAPRTAGSAQAGASAGASSAAPLAVVGELSSTQWEQLISRIAALPAPKVAVKPSSAAVPDR